MENVAWWRLFVKDGMAGEVEKLAAPFFRFAKQIHRRTWILDALFEAVGGCAWKRACTGDETCQRRRSKGRLKAGSAGAGTACP